MKIEDIVLYICTKYPLPEELSKARLTKLVYLADWKSCVNTGKQLSKIQWYFHNFGPYVDDVVNAARSCNNLDVIETENFYGDKKELIVAKKDAVLPRLDRENTDLLDAVIEDTRKLYWNDFIRYVYDTPPIAQSNRHTFLNLEKFAKQARAR